MMEEELWVVKSLYTKPHMSLWEATTANAHIGLAKS